MAIYKGDKKVIALYKGDKKIIKRYKGTQVVYDVTNSGGGEEYPENTLVFDWEKKGTNGNTYYVTYDKTDKFYTASTNPEILTLDTYYYNIGVVLHNITVTNFLHIPNVMLNNNPQTLFYSYNNENVVLNGLHTSVVNMNDIFMGNINFNSKIKTIEFRNWKLFMTKSIDFIFGSVSNYVEEINLSGWQLSDGITIDELFFNCTKLTKVNVSGWDVVGKNGTDIFTNCTALNTLILGNVSQSQYDWWYQHLVNAGIQNQVTIEYTIIE